MNRAILIGRVGQAPNTTTTQGGTVITKFTLATSERYKNKEGDRTEKTEWHNVRTWNKTASFVDKYVKKGAQLLVEGKIRNEKYEAKDGTVRYVTIIDADNIELLSPKQEENGKAERKEQKHEQESAPDADDSLEEQPDDLPF